LLIPGGVDRYFQQVSSMLQAASSPDADAIQRMASEYGIEFNFRSVPSLCERFGVTFGSDSVGQDFRPAHDGRWS
jgi:hypothetical protein